MILIACGRPAASADDAAWLAALAQPPRPAAAWPLASLADPSGAADAGWHLAANNEGAAPALCRAGGPAATRSLAGVALADFDVRVRARTEPDTSEHYGIVFRGGSADDYYLARVDTRNNNVRLYRRHAGANTLLTARDLGVSVGQWHELAVREAGPRLSVALDGEPVLNATDDSLTAGSIGLWAGADTRVCFAGVWLTPRGPAS